MIVTKKDILEIFNKLPGNNYYDEISILIDENRSNKNMIGKLLIIRKILSNSIIKNNKILTFPSNINIQVPCEICNNDIAEYVVNPYKSEIYDMTEYCYICNCCYNELCEDI